MTRIKICGITDIEDARAAVDYGADALGFILVEESPRYVGAEGCLYALLDSVPPLTTRVGVCRNPIDLNRFPARFEAAQHYDTEFDQNRAWYGEYRLIYAHRVADEASLQGLDEALRSMYFLNGESPISAILLDAYHPGKLGGSGETFNWELAVEAKRRFAKPIILAGGLTPDNVEEAIATVRPYAVDVSSGVEAEPGRKDHAKLRAFIRAVRRADG